MLVCYGGNKYRAHIMILAPENLEMLTDEVDRKSYFGLISVD